MESGNCRISNLEKGTQAEADLEFNPAPSKGLGRSAGSLSLKKRPWFDQIVETGSRKSAGSENVNLTQGPGKPRLWIDATRSEEGIEEAVCRFLL